MGGPHGSISWVVPCNLRMLGNKGNLLVSQQSLVKPTGQLQSLSLGVPPFWQLFPHVSVLELGPGQLQSNRTLFLYLYIINIKYQEQILEHNWF